MGPATPQSNQRGIETVLGALTARIRIREPQSNQRGIETDPLDGIRRLWNTRLNRTSVGLKLCFVRAHNAEIEWASIEPAWD